MSRDQMRVRGLGFWVIPFVALVLAVMGACAPQAPAPNPPLAPPTLAATPAPPSATSPSPEATPTAYEKVKAEFEKVVAAAKKEAKVTYYHAAPKSISDALQKAWEKKYPDIALESVSGTTAANLARIAAEQRAKTYVADVYMTGSSSSWGLKRDGYLTMFDPLRVLPSLNDPTVKWMMDLFVDPDGYYVSGYMATLNGIAISTNLVPPDREPKGWADLVDPYWKGKILQRDPTSAGAGNSWLLLSHRVLGEDYIKKIAEQKPKMGPSDGTEAVKMVARGEYQLFFPAELEDIANMPAGSPIKAVFPREGLYSSTSAFSLVKNGPHPNAALVFAEFLLSKEGQEAIASSGRPIARVGVPLRDPKIQDLTGKTVVAPTEDEVLNKGPKLTEQAKKWFGLD